MKRFLAIILCAVLVPVPGALGQTAPAPQKTIKDAVEYHAYIAALNTADPAAKSAAYEAFLSAYPNSIMVPDALGQAMAAYQSVGDVAKVTTTALRLLVLQPNDLRCLAVLTFVDRTAATRGEAGALAEMRDYVVRGLHQLPVARPLDGMSATEFEAMRTQMRGIFYGAQGFDLLSQKQYPGARDAYLKAIEADPADLSNNYQLGIAEVQMNPPAADGFWYLARAINLAAAQHNDAAASSIATFAKAKYGRYHGSDDGWDTLVTRVGTSAPIPLSFANSIKLAPTPAEIAVKAVAENDPASLSISDWEYVLSYRDTSPANAAAAAKVWAAIQAKLRGGAGMLALPVVIVSSTPTSIDAAITEDDIKSHIADVHVVLATPPAQMPAVGARVTVTGAITGYQLHPFRFEMTKGSLTPVSGTPQ